MAGLKEWSSGSNGRGITAVRAAAAVLFAAILLAGVASFLCRNRRNSIAEATLEERVRTATVEKFRPVDPGEEKDGQGESLPPPVADLGRREIVIGPDALSVDEPNARFSDVDFVYVGNTEDGGKETSTPRSIRLLSSRATFERCTFRPRGGTAAPPMAIVWDFPGESNEPDEPRLLTGKLVFRDCIFAGLAGAVACDPRCSLVFEFDNVLHLCGPLVRARSFPAADSPFLIRLSRCTLRESGPLILWKNLSPRSKRMPGPIRVEAKACVFALGSGAGLFGAEEGRFTEGIVARLTWTGEGSILAPGSPIFVPFSQSEEDAAVRGLVRSTIGFAGLPTNRPDDNAAREWRAPLKTPAPPGIVPSRIRGLRRCSTLGTRTESRGD